MHYTWYLKLLKLPVWKCNSLICAHGITDLPFLHLQVGVRRLKFGAFQRLTFGRVSKEAAGQFQGPGEGMCPLTAPHSEQHHLSARGWSGEGLSSWGKKEAWRETFDSESERTRIFGCPCCWLWSGLKGSAHSLCLPQLCKWPCHGPYPRASDLDFKAGSTPVLDVPLFPFLQLNTHTYTLCLHVLTRQLRDPCGGCVSKTEIRPISNFRTTPD